MENKNKIMERMENKNKISKNNNEIRCVKWKVKKKTLSRVDELCEERNDCTAGKSNCA